MVEDVSGDPYPEKDVWIYPEKEIRRGLGNPLQTVQSFFTSGDHEVSRD